MQLEHAVIQAKKDFDFSLFCSSRIKSQRIDGALEEIIQIAKEEKISQLAIFPENKEVSRFRLFLGTHRVKEEKTKLLLNNGEKVILEKDDDVEDIVIINNENKVFQFTEPAHAV